MPVNSKHPEYVENVGRWNIVRDVINSNVKQYIKNVEDTTTITQDGAAQESDVDQGPSNKYYNGALCYKMACNRNERYKDDAIFTNFARRTLNGLIGAIFRKETVVKLPPKIDYLEYDATGTNMSMNKLAQQIAGQLLETGRYGLLVDHPSSEEGLTRQQVEKLNLMARIYTYEADSIINWATTKENGLPKLTFVMLKEECDEIGDDGFAWVKRVKYRELRLVDGIYVQTIYDQDGKWEREYMPRDFEGNPWDRIPFVFVGSENNNPKVDSSPLYDLCMINIGHYRNSADFEEAVFLTGQPTMIISSDMNTDVFHQFYPDGIKIGSRRGYFLGSNGRAEFLQSNAANIASDIAMKRKEEQMAMIGARIVTVGGTNETAEGVRMRLSGETCELSIIALNTEDALEICCEYAAWFMGGVEQIDQIDISINTDFIEQSIDAPKIAQLIVLMNNGIITKNDVRDLLREIGDIDPERTNQQIELEVQRQNMTANPFAGATFLNRPTPAIAEIADETDDAEMVAA